MYDKKINTLILSLIDRSKSRKPLASGQPATTLTSASQRSDADKLAVTMTRTKLDTEESQKKQKTTDPMNLEHENIHPQLPLPPGSQQ